jgi:hypothetical protein
MNDAEEVPGDDAEPATGDAVDGLEIEVEIDDPWSGDRMMAETLFIVISNRYEEPFPNAGVQISYERMMIAAMERVSRICRNDLPADQP